MDKQMGEIEKSYREAVTDFTTDSGITVKGVYTAEDISDIDVDSDIGLPGEYPFTRGHHSQMYRGKLWNIREISGVSTPARFNEWLKFLISEGASALDWVQDAPSNYTIEPDQPAAKDQVGGVGVSLQRLKDVEVLCEGLPLDQVSICFSGDWPIFPQAYILAAKRRGYDIAKLRGVGGSLQPWTPVFKPSYTEMQYVNGRLSTLGRWGFDFAEYTMKNTPRWNWWSFDGAAYGQLGTNAIQEIACLVACQKEIVREMLKRGIDINAIGRKLSPVTGIGRDFFEEIAKMRAARRIWARTMKEEFGATDPKAMTLRMHANAPQGGVYTRQQPLVNMVRGTMSSLSAVLGGCMGLQTTSYDEAWCAPSEEAVTLAIRTQQVLRYESGVAKVADPLAGSYYMEWLTSKLEEEIMSMVDKIEQLGGWMAVMISGWIQQEIMNNFIETEKKVDRGERVLLGVNRFAIPPEEDFQPKLYVRDVGDIEPYLDEYKAFKTKRNLKGVEKALESLRHAAENMKDNLVPYVFQALEADATFPEIFGVFRMVDGLEYDWAGEREYPF